MTIFIAMLFTVVLPHEAYANKTWEERLYNVPAFKFINQEKGIGCGVCPVYTAPFEEAYRVNGNAV